MRFGSRDENRCPATTGSAYQVAGQQDFRCDLDDDGHEWHEHDSELFTGRWRMNGSTMQVEAVRSGRPGGSVARDNKFTLTVNTDGVPPNITVFSQDAK